VNFDVTLDAALDLNLNLALPVSPIALRSMLGDGGELALIDVREELIFSQNHLLLDAYRAVRRQ